MKGSGEIRDGVEPVLTGRDDFHIVRDQGCSGGGEEDQGRGETRPYHIMRDAVGGVFATLAFDEWELVSYGLEDGSNCREEASDGCEAVIFALADSADEPETVADESVASGTEGEVVVGGGQMAFGEGEGASDEREGMSDEHGDASGEGEGFAGEGGGGGAVGCSVGAVRRTGSRRTLDATTTKKRRARRVPAYRIPLAALNWSGWNGPPARPRRQLAAESNAQTPFNSQLRVVRAAVGLVARQDGPVARSTRSSLGESVAHGLA
jgi:hypothetical protein